MQINGYNRVHQQSHSLNVCSWYFFMASLDKSVLQRNRNTISFLQKEKTHKLQIRLCIHNQAQSCGACVSFSIGPMCKYQFNVMKMAPICDFTIPKNYQLFCHTPIITRSEKQSGIQTDDLVVGYRLQVLAKQVQVQGISCKEKTFSDEFLYDKKG